MKIIKTARTFLPFDNHVTPSGETTLSPTTNKSILPTNNVFTIQDIIFDGRKYVLPGGGGDWSSGDEAQPPSYKSKGDDYKSREQYLDLLRKQRYQFLEDKLTTGKPFVPERWEVIMKGGTVTFPSFSLAQQYQEKAKSKGVLKTYLHRVAQKDKVELAYEAISKTFLVESMDIVKGIEETGSAFCVAPKFFLTCAHVVEKYDKNNIPNVKNFGVNRRIRLVQKGRFYTATVAAYNLEWDIAVLKADIEVDPFQINPSILIGEDVFAIGSPLGFENNVSEGIIGSTDKKIYNYKGAPDYIFIDASIHPGNSGGAIVKQDDGSVIGLVTLIVSHEGFYGLNAALPSSNILTFLKKNKIL